VYNRVIIAELISKMTAYIRFIRVSDDSFMTYIGITTHEELSCHLAVCVETVKMMASCCGLHLLDLFIISMITSQSQDLLDSTVANHGLISFSVTANLE